MMEADAYCLLDHVQFTKHGWQNRNRIAGKAGEIMLTVPVLQRGICQTSIDEVRISNPEGSWRSSHWRSIEQSYGRTPYFSDHAPFFESLYKRRWDKLIDLNITVITYIRDALGISTPLHSTRAMGVAGAKNDLLIDICRTVKADSYLSGNGARGYMDEELFERAGIAVKYTSFRPIKYHRNGRDFYENLSTLDLLFHHGPEAGSIIRDSCASLTTQ